MMKLFQNFWKAVGSFFFLVLMIPLNSMTLSAYADCISAKKANLRTEPTTKSSISWKVFQNMPLRKIKTEENWVQVKDVDGQSHWIFHRLLTKDYTCAVIKVPKAHLRSGPGTQYQKIPGIAVAEKYTAFKFLLAKNGWAKLEDEYGQRLWVARKLIWVQ